MTDEKLVIENPAEEFRELERRVGGVYGCDIELVFRASALLDRMGISWNEQDDDCQILVEEFAAVRDIALDHLRNVLYSIAEMRENDRSRPIKEAFDFYNAARPNKRVEFVDVYRFDHGDIV